MNYSIKRNIIGCFQALVLLYLIFLPLMMQAQDQFLFVGTYTNAKPDKGIYIYKFDTKTGSLTLFNTGQNITNPSYLTIHPNGKYVYSCTETQMNDNGNVSAFAFDKQKGSLKLLNKVASGGDNPCYVAIDKSGKWLVTANYSGGSAAISAIEQNGLLKQPAQILKFSGSGFLKDRQEASHIHQSTFTPDHNFLLLSDLGSDKIWTYQFNPVAPEPLQKFNPESIILEPGSGPRHLTFHPNKKYAYCIEELSGMVSAYSYKKGNLSAIQRIAAHEPQLKGPFGSADIHISPNGKFLYCSNRGSENTISIFAISKGGTLKLSGIQSTLGTHPRNFMIDPSGKYLLVANMHSNNIVVFKRNKITGLLTPTGIEVSVPRPACLQMLKI